MKRVISTLFLAAAGLAPLCGYAEIRPSFRLATGIKLSSDIVIASEGDKVDGRLRVLEALKGSLSAGYELEIPELAEFSSAESRTVDTFWRGDEKDKDRVVTGERMVLFLNRKPTPDGDGFNWGPMGSWMSDLKTSVAWIEGGRVYAFCQVCNPGDSILVKQHLTEKEFFKDIRGNLDILLKLEALVGKQDAVRAKAAYSQLDTEFECARNAAFCILGDSGREGFIYLLKVLHDPERLSLHYDAIQSLGSAEGEDVVPVLTRRMEEELAYWKKTSPELRADWWQKSFSEDERLSAPRHRYHIAFKAIEALAEFDAPSSRAIVAEFRDYWKSQPVLSEQGRRVP